MQYEARMKTVEGFKWTGGPEQQEDPEWIIAAILAGNAWFENEGSPDVEFIIDTCRGTQRAVVGDYILRGTNGELYICKTEVFEAFYEPVKIG